MSGGPAPSGPPARLLLADSDPALRHPGATPILLLTWSGDPDRQAVPEIAAHDLLTKPFGISQLLDRLQALRDRAHPPTRQGQNHATGADAPWTPS